MKPSTIASVIASALSTELAAQSTDPKGSIRGDDASYPSQLTIRLRVPAVMKYHTHPGSNLRTQSFEEGSGDTTHVGIGQTRPIEMRTISLPLFGGDKWSLILSQPEAITYTDGETHKIIRCTASSEVSGAASEGGRPSREGVPSWLTIAPAATCTVVTEGLTRTEAPSEEKEVEQYELPPVSTVNEVESKGLSKDEL